MFGGGTGTKPGDNYCVLINWETHRDIHQYGEKRILCEKYGYTKEWLKKECEDQYNRWLKTV